MDEMAQARVDAAIAMASSRFSDGADWDSIMAELRSAGFRMNEAVHATRVVLNLKPGAAIGRVIDSPAWEDHREATIAANEAFRQAVRERADVWREDGSGWEATIDLVRRGRGDVQETLRTVVRGERPLDALTEIGVRLEFNAEGFRAHVPSGLAFEVPLADLAHGLLTTWARGKELREWAITMLAIDADFDEIGSADGAALLDALWSASAGDAVSEESLEAARRLAG